MSRAFTFAIPGDLSLKTGGYAYDRAVIARIGAYGWEAEVLGLGPGFPLPDAATLAAAEARLSALPDGRTVLVDGLAYGVLDRWAEREAGRLRIVALVHHPLALESGTPAETAARFKASEARALSFARHVVVTSPLTARELAAHFGVAAEKITVAPPGTEPAPRATGGGAAPLILSIGTLTFRKGHDVLLDALKRIEDLPWRARIVGSRDLDPATAAALERQARGLGLSDRVTFAGTSDDPRTEMATADIFALASRYEGYGMVFAEALSQGLPVVACAAGAVPEVVPAEAGLLVPPDDPQAFAGALRLLLTDRSERLRRAEAAARAGATLPGWDDTARLIAAALEKVP